MDKVKRVLPIIFSYGKSCWGDYRQRANKIRKERAIKIRDEIKTLIRARK